MVRSSISKAAEVATTDLHTNNTELYNCGACYHSEAFNEDGLLDFEKFPKNKLYWR